jgi:hypothetical protein
MKRVALLALLVLAAAIPDGWAAEPSRSGPARSAAPYSSSPDVLQARLEEDPYDYRARQQLVQAYQEAGGHAAGYYQAAWLAWLAPRRYAQSGASLLRDRRERDRAAAEGGAPAAAVIAAGDAARSLADTCLNGAISVQAPRLQAEVEELISRAEQADASASRADPVVRVALAHLYLTLDDCLLLEDTAASRRARPRALQKAASLAAAVAGWLPKSPAAHRTLAVARARLAQLENRAELWDLAIQECEMAQALDPDDPALSKMVWTLHLRAGHWAEAKRWQTGGPATGAAGDVSPKKQGSAQGK